MHHASAYNCGIFQQLIPVFLGGNMKKRLLLCTLILALVAALFSVGAVAFAAQDDDFLAVGEGKAALEGKKIIFVGQSYTYYGNVVEKTSGSDTNCSQTKRTTNDGYFYRLCKSVGISSITITDWAFPSHSLEDLFDGSCEKGDGHTAGRDHLADLTNRNYDYVVLQGSNEGYETAEEYYNLVKGIMDVFREANPNVKFIYVLHNAVYTSYSSAWRQSVSMIEDEGAIIVDWGSLVVDVYAGAVEVPGATLDYNKSSFIISQSASNKANPNLLSGYLYSLMTYCAITGETPVGHSWAFAKSYTGLYSLDRYTSDYYKYDDPTTADVDESVTNMSAIFGSDADMTGLQTLAAQYLGMKNYEGYTVTFKDDNGTVLSTGYYSAGDAVTPPESPTKASTENYSYTFIGWDKEVEPTATKDATYTAVYEKSLLKEWGTFNPGSTASEFEGKKVFISGCSYSYYGGIVEQNGVATDLTSDGRKNDKGYLYKLFRANGATVTVTDWVYGGHDLTDIFDGSCASGHHDGYDHFADLTNLYYDYVILQEIQVPGYKSADYYNNVTKIVDIFREANPDVKVYYTVHHMVYDRYGNEWRKHIQMVEDYGVTIIDWGALVYEILEGKVDVPGAEYEYFFNTFVVSNDAGDGYHPSLLAGYINTLMTYCTITGETPIGQPLDFLYTSTGKYLGIDMFIDNHYKYDDPATEFDESVTNFKEIMYSESDMLGLQTLAAQYMNAKRWREYVDYTVRFLGKDGSVIAEQTYKWGDTVTAPAVADYVEGEFKYVFKSWDKEIELCTADVIYTAIYEQVELPPVEPDPDTPVEPDPETPVEPDPETPAEPDPETPVEPDPETPVEPDPDTPTEPDPDTPVEPDPETPAEPDPETPVEPDPETPVEPDPDTPAEPDPETPDDSTTEPEAPADEHVCENVGGFAKFWNAIANFFRRLFGKPALCPCGKFEI